MDGHGLDGIPFAMHKPSERQNSCAELSAGPSLPLPLLAIRVHPQAFQPVKWHWPTSKGWRWWRMGGKRNCWAWAGLLAESQYGTTHSTTCSISSWTVSCNVSSRFCCQPVVILWPCLTDWSKALYPSRNATRENTTKGGMGKSYLGLQVFLGTPPPPPVPWKKVIGAGRFLLCLIQILRWFINLLEAECKNELRRWRLNLAFLERCEPAIWPCLLNVASSPSWKLLPLSVFPTPVPQQSNAPQFNPFPFYISQRSSAGGRTSQTWQHFIAFAETNFNKEKRCRISSLKAHRPDHNVADV